MKKLTGAGLLVLAVCYLVAAQFYPEVHADTYAIHDGFGRLVGEAPGVLAWFGLAYFPGGLWFALDLFNFCSLAGMGITLLTLSGSDWNDEARRQARLAKPRDPFVRADTPVPPDTEPRAQVQAESPAVHHNV